MSAQAQLEIPMTSEAYLAFEREAEEKHEFVDGIIYAMAGASRNHNEITGNLHGEIWTRFKKRHCYVYSSDMRVKVNQDDYVYPDIMAVCGDMDLEDNHFDTLLNPSVIIEVLSDSTKRYDATQKAALYQNMATVQDYVLVVQDKYRIEHYQRQSKNQWLLTVLTELEQVLTLKSINVEITLQDIYDKVVFGNE